MIILTYEIHSRKEPVSLAEFSICYKYKNKIFVNKQINSQIVEKKPDEIQFHNNALICLYWFIYSSVFAYHMYINIQTSQVCVFKYSSPNADCAVAAN